MDWEAFFLSFFSVLCAAGIAGVTYLANKRGEVYRRELERMRLIQARQDLEADIWKFGHECPDCGKWLHAQETKLFGAVWRCAPCRAERKNLPPDPAPCICYGLPDSGVECPAHPKEPV